ncbi:MAG: extracellular solute-binding protein, partial [Variovorax sp.]|nr:extracellular solute-binding protein [Variovorax sp.]
MSPHFHRLARLGVLAAALVAAGGAMAQTAICYNCPTEWADWGTQLKAIKARTGITVPADNKNSGQSLAQLVAEKASPVADVTYLGVTFAVQAAKDGVIEPYKPAAWKDIPDGLKDPAGHWFTIHSGTLGFMVNVDALKGKPVPKSWADLLKPEYKGLIGYLDPASAFVGYVGAVAVNQARGGTLDNFKPGIDYFKALQKNEPIVPKQTSYARVLSGEIAILLDYDFNAYRAKYKDKANVAFVIPSEGTLAVPYVMSLVAKAPHAADAKK